jgi:hypothetical protein
MTIEAAVVVGLDGEQVLYWHLPPNRNIVALPDSGALFRVFQENKLLMAGGAHSHPGTGWPAPSWEDITTNHCIDTYFGRRYKWWVASMDRLVLVEWGGPGKFDYRVTKVYQEPGWVQELRRLSQEEVTAELESNRKER